MIVHFICEGNTYRSRLAEAYLKSLKIPGVDVMSSGTHAERNLSGPITPYAKILLKEYGLDTYCKHHWDQLTQARINKADIVVCMNREIHQDCKAKYRLPPQTLIWDIPDVKTLLPSYATLMAQSRAPKITETTFKKIRHKVDELIIVIKKQSGKLAQTQ